MEGDREGEEDWVWWVEGVGTLELGVSHLSLLLSSLPSFHMGSLSSVLDGGQDSPEYKGNQQQLH